MTTIKKKVKLAWIVNDAARKICLRKRKAGLNKKISELTILCDVMACMVMFCPDKTEPTIWPNHETARALIERFFTLPEIERTKKAVNHETYLKDRVDKTQNQVTKLKKKNKESEIDRLLSRNQRSRSIDELAINAMQGLMRFMQDKMKECTKRVEFIQQVPIGNRLNQTHEAQIAADMRDCPSSSHYTGYRNLMHQPNINFNYNNNIYNNNNNNNNVGLNNKYLVGGSITNGYEEMGPMFDGNSGYGNYGGMSLSLNHHNYLGAQTIVTPNMNVAGFHPTRELSYANLILGLSSYSQDNKNIAVNGLNSGLNTDLGLHRSFPTVGAAFHRNHQREGEPRWEIPENYRPESSSGMSGRGNGGASDMGLQPPDVSQAWPNNDNFHR